MVIDPDAKMDAPAEDESAPPDRCGNGLEKVYPTIAVRYGYMNNVGEFTHPQGMKFSCGARVVIKTRRGIEVGQSISLTCSGCDRSVSREQIQTYIRNSGPEYYELGSGRILREATQDDLREASHLHDGTAEKRDYCQAIADRLSLPLKVVECEHLLGGERVVFYFLAEGRVDFRSLVKELAVEYQTRIEMRQVGVRDEARLLADYETCGRECCCKVFLKTLRPVSMKMAKMQKATLDPSKVSGRCGRLKCCLRYEHVAYEELERRLPPMGRRVSTPHGDGVIVNRQIITQLVQVEGADGKLFAVAVEDIDPIAPRSDRQADAQNRGEPAPRPADSAKTVDPPPAQKGKAPPPGGPAKGAADGQERGPDQSTRRRRRRRRRPPGGQPQDSGGGSGS
ncbi:MAG: signal peptidase [bacterium]|nr:signal peptidase [bacterium]